MTATPSPDDRGPSVLRVSIDAERIAFRIDGTEHVVEAGPAVLNARELHSDPPRPEELTNAIGVVLDHLDDLVRTTPSAIGARVEVDGVEAAAAAAVEVGGPPALPLTLGRDAVEDVFRTVATEAARDRRRNPGLAPELVGTVVAGCCVLVAVMRRLHLDEITVTG